MGDAWSLLRDSPHWLATRRLSDRQSPYRQQRAQLVRLQRAWDARPLAETVGAVGLAAGVAPLVGARSLHEQAQNRYRCRRRRWRATRSFQYRAPPAK